MGSAAKKGRDFWEWATVIVGGKEKGPGSVFKKRWVNTNVKMTD